MYSDDNDSLTSSINKMFFNLIQRMASTLGMYTLSDLILNTGTRSTAYYQGIMPYSWFRGANIVFWIAQVAAFFTLLFGLLKMIIDRNISVVGLGKSNSKASFDLKQGSLDFMKAIILMMLFVPVFYLLTSLNGYVVQTCAALAKNTSFIDLAGSSSLAGLIINLAYLGILIKLNVDFLIRAVTCTVLYSMSPLAISSLVIGNNKGSLFNTWSRELICNIFLQTFDAVIFVFFATMIGSGTSNTIERITLCYAFIPLNKWFKDNLMGFRGVGGSEAAEEAGKNERGMFANLGMGAMGLASVGLTRAGQNVARKVTENNDEIASLRAQQKNEKLYGQQEKVTAANELMGNVVGAKNVNQNKLRGALDAVGEKHNQEVRARNELRQQKIDALENKNKDLRRWSAGFGGANNLVGATALMGGIAASGAGDNTKAAFDMAVGKGFANAMDENIVAAKGKTGMEASAELINSKIKTTPLPGQEKPLDAEQLIKQTSPNSNIAEMGYSGERGVNLFKHKDGTYTKDRHAGNDNQPAVGFEINTNEYDAGKVKGMLQEKGVTVAEGKGGKLCAIYDGASTDDKGNVTNMSNRLVDLSSCAKNAYDGNYSAPTEGQINARENPVEPVYDNVGKKVSDPVLVGDRTPEQINPKLSPDARAYVQTPAVKAEIGNEVLKPITEQPAEPPLSRSKGSAGKSYSKGNRSGDSGKQNGGTSGKDKAEKKTPNSNKK